MNLYIVSDENYTLVVRANDWKDAMQKAIDYAKSKYALDISQLDVSLCENNEIIE